jgi:hypothetical protein
LFVIEASVSVKPCFLRLPWRGRFRKSALRQDRTGETTTAPALWAAPDFDLARDIIDRMHGDDGIDIVARKYYAYVEALAEKLVTHHWNDIEAAAKALLECETLTGDEIWQVIREARSRQVEQLLQRARA